MKDQITRLTAICKELAEIRNIYLERGYTGSTAKDLRDLEQQVADLRDMLNFD